MHHANLLIGSYDWASTHIPAIDEGVNGGVRVFHFSRMSIADVRTLIYEAGLRPVHSDVQVFVVQTDSLLHEAQNALLKTLEEPPQHTRFYFVVPRGDMLLPTLLSRFHVLAEENAQGENQAFTEFLKASYSERLAEIVKRLDAEDASWVTDIVSGATHFAHEKRDARFMRTMLNISSYIHTAGSSKKMLLEHLALTLVV